MPFRANRPRPPGKGFPALSCMATAIIKPRPLGAQPYVAQERPAK